MAQSIRLLMVMPIEIELMPMILIVVAIEERTFCSIFTRYFPFHFHFTAISIHSHLQALPHSTLGIVDISCLWLCVLVTECRFLLFAHCEQNTRYGVALNVNISHLTFLFPQLPSQLVLHFILISHSHSWSLSQFSPGALTSNNSDIIYLHLLDNATDSSTPTMAHSSHSTGMDHDMPMHDMCKMNVCTLLFHRPIHGRIHLILPI